MKTRGLLLKIYDWDRPKHCWTNTQKNNNVEKQAGAELGQAQLKLELVDVGLAEA